MQAQAAFTSITVVFPAQAGMNRIRLITISLGQDLVFPAQAGMNRLRNQLLRQVDDWLCSPHRRG